MIVFSSIIILSFVVFFTPGQSFTGTSYAFKVDGKRITHKQLQEVADQISAFMGGNSGIDNNRLRAEAVQMVVLREKAKTLGINASTDEVLDRVLKNKAFHTDGKYDHAKFELFEKKLTSERGLPRNSLTSLHEQDIIREKTAHLISSSVQVTPTELLDVYNQYNEKATIQVIRFEPETYRKQITPPSKDEIQAYVTQNASVLLTPQKRKIEYVRIPYSTNEKIDESKLNAEYERYKSVLNDKSGKPMPVEEGKKVIRKELTAEAGRRVALEVANKIVENTMPNDDQKLLTFAESAKKENVPLVESPWISAEDDGKNLPNPAMVGEVFKLVPSRKMTDPLQANDAVYILSLKEVQEPQPMESKQAELQAFQALTQQAIFKKMTDHAAAVQAQFQQQSGQGASFEKTAAALGLKVTSIPSQSILERSTSRVQGDVSEMVIREVAAGLPSGQVSNYRPIEGGGVIVFVKDRTIPTEEQWNKDRESFAKTYETGKKEAAFGEWLLFETAKTGALAKNLE